MENGPFIDGLPNLIAWKWMSFTFFLFIMVNNGELIMVIYPLMGGLLLFTQIYRWIGINYR